MIIAGYFCFVDRFGRLYVCVCDGLQGSRCCGSVKAGAELGKDELIMSVSCFLFFFLSALGWLWTDYVTVLVREGNWRGRGRSVCRLMRSTAVRGVVVEGFENEIDCDWPF